MADLDKPWRFLRLPEDPLQLLFEEIDALSRKPDRYKQYSKEPT
jgi:hypothetical protein